MGAAAGIRANGVLDGAEAGPVRADGGESREAAGTGDGGGNCGQRGLVDRETGGGEEQDQDLAAVGEDRADVEQTGAIEGGGEVPRLTRGRWHCTVLPPSQHNPPCNGPGPRFASRCST